MTVQYLKHFHKKNPFLFLCLLRRWRGGVLRLVWIELIFLGVLYTILSLLYRLAMNSNMKNKFEVIVNWTNSHLTLVPVIFILSFYISAVFKRFWKYYQTIPWTTNLSLCVSEHIKSSNSAKAEKVEAIRWTILRLSNAAFVLTCRSICIPVLKRFPDLKSLVTAKLLTDEEVEEIEKSETRDPKYYLPLLWAANIAKRADAEGLIPLSHGLCDIVEEINKLRDGYLMMLHIDFIPLPLVYSQVVTISVYTYTLLCVVGRQYLVTGSKNNPNNSLDAMIPFFTLLEVSVYLSCLKVAETMMNPMGTDVDDFEMNSIVDYCIETSKTIVEVGKTEAVWEVSECDWDSGKIFNEKSNEGSKV